MLRRVSAPERAVTVPVRSFTTPAQLPLRPRWRRTSVASLSAVPLSVSDGTREVIGIYPDGCHYALKSQEVGWNHKLADIGS